MSSSEFVSDVGLTQAKALGTLSMFSDDVECEELLLTVQRGAGSVQGTSAEQRGVGLHLLQDSSIP